jgi:hypothetical protein
LWYVYGHQGEVKREKSSSAQGKNRLLVSGYDSYTITGSKLIDFSQNGAGLLAHLSIARSLKFAADQYGDVENNMIHYLAATSFNEFSSVAHYFKKNQHSYFTAGIELCIVFRRLTSDSHLDITVHNLDESSSVDFDFLDGLIAAAKHGGMSVNVAYAAEPFIAGIVAPTVVVSDRSSGKA